MKRTDDMRQAVAAGDWPAVLRLWERYAAGILDDIRRGTCMPQRMSEAGEFLEWAQRIALCQRAQNQQRLAALHAAQQYGPSPEDPRPRMRTSL